MRLFSHAKYCISGLKCNHNLGHIYTRGVSISLVCQLLREFVVDISPATGGLRNYISKAASIRVYVSQCEFVFFFSGANFQSVGG